MSELNTLHQFWIVKSGDYKGLRETFDALNDRIDELEAENAALKEERRWKNTEIELPKEDTEANALMVIFRHSGELVRTAFGLEYSDEFVRHFSHWMQMPTLPESHK